MSQRKKKRSLETASLSTTSCLPSKEITNLQDCYYFVSPNEYSDKTFGLLAFFLRKPLGDINFSDILDEVERHDQNGYAIDCAVLLEDKRKNLSEIEASIEKCLILNRLISYIEENKTDFVTTVFHILSDMKDKIIDKQINQMVQYPIDFRQREADVLKRKNAQNVRRLFYFSHNEVKEPPSLIHLQNRTTEHLTYLIDHRMKCEPKFRDTGIKEITKIFANSFMINVQPHYRDNPVIIYEKQKPGIYTAKVSVIIVSLLHDFMETHPNMIELYDIEPSLCPSSSHYKLAEPQSISWKTCHLQIDPGEKPQIIQYAELSLITIQQKNENDSRVHFTQALHSFKFAIKFHVNLPEYRFAGTHKITLESLQFVISPRNDQIPQLLTRVILNDIKRHSNLQLNHIRLILCFIIRYFMHRTGVRPKEDLKIYLEEELTKAKDARKNFQTFEDIYMDFLVPFVSQVEFMAKHPILAMFYAEGLFLGPCNSARAAEIMKKSPNVNSSIFGLRFNSIEVDYRAIAMKPVSNRTIKPNQCAVRVNIYRNPKKGIENHTFDSAVLINDISKFVCTSHSKNVGRIRVLSNLDGKIDGNTYKSFTEFSKYFHDRLHEISKTDEKYKPIADLTDDINNGDDKKIFNDEENQMTVSDDNSQSNDSISPTRFDSVKNFNTNTVPVYSPIPYNNQINNEASSRTVLPLSDEQIIQHVLSDPALIAQLMYEMNRLNLTTPQQRQFNQPHPQFLYQQQQFNQPHPQFLYQQQSSLIAVVQQFLQQMAYQQQQQCTQQLEQQQQQCTQQLEQQQQQCTQQLEQQQQQCTQQLEQQQKSPHISLYQPNGVNQPQVYCIDGINGSSKQRSTQVETLETSEDDFNQSTLDILELITTDQVPPAPTDQDFQLMLDEALADILSFQNGQ